MPDCVRKSRQVYAVRASLTAPPQRFAHAVDPLSRRCTPYESVFDAVRLSPPRKLRFSQYSRVAHLQPRACNSSRRPKSSITSREDPLWRYGRPNEREVSMRASESTAAYGRLPWPQTPALPQFHSEPRPDERDAVQTPNTDKSFFAKRTEPARAAPTEVSFGPFRLLPTQFLLL